MALDAGFIFVMGFVDQLPTLPLADWYALATIGDRRLDSAERALANAINTPDALFAGWLVRDHVETAFHRFDSPEGRRVCSRSRLCDVRLSTQRAAQALLVRPRLDATDVALLCGGFVRLLPPPNTLR